MKKPICAAVATALLLCLPGCLFGSQSSATYSGRYVSEEQMLRVDVGAGEQEVEAMLGAPSNRSDIGDGKTLWTWHYTRTEKRSSHVFLILASQHEDTYEGTVYVRFDKGKVDKVWRAQG